MENLQLRQEIIETAIAFNTTGLSVGTSGNLSARIETGYLITPTGIAYDLLKPENLVEMDLEGHVIEGNLKPSSEWPFHKAIYASRDEVNAVVHVHSPYATGIACTRKDVPAFHYMIALAGGNSIRCAEYATFGTDALSDNALAALETRKACLLANHGQITIGADINAAFKLATEVENLAKQYWISKQFDEPIILDEEEMQTNLEKFSTYGKQYK